MLWVSAVFESLAGVMASQPPRCSRRDSDGRFELDVFCESELVSGAAAMTLSPSDCLLR